MENLTKLSKVEALPVEKILLNHTIPYYDKENNFKAISMEVWGVRKEEQGYEQIKFHEIDQDPIESILLTPSESGQISKCFTFFSSLSKKLRNFKLVLDKIHFNVSQRNQ